jgi:hypothetical protein
MRVIGMSPATLTMLCMLYLIEPGETDLQAYALGPPTRIYRRTMLDL